MEFLSDRVCRFPNGETETTAAAGCLIVQARLSLLSLLYCGFMSAQHRINLKDGTRLSGFNSIMRVHILSF